MKDVLASGRQCGRRGSLGLAVVLVLVSLGWVARGWAAEGAATGEMLALVIDKGRLQARLVTWPGPSASVSSRVLREFQIAIGKQDGDKEKEGDLRTPEGIYQSLRVLDGKELPEKYGARAIPLNFPNPMDLMHGKTGSGIWLHGVDSESRVSEARVTEGCVAFYNADIEWLATWLRPNQGVVLIAQDASRVNQADEVGQVHQATEAWMRAWASRDVDGYIGSYAPDFVLDRMDRNSYRNYKEKVFRSYQTMRVEFDTVRVLTHPKYAMVMMNQDFYGDDRFVSKGRKVLYWSKSEEQGWKIVREVFETQKIEFAAALPPASDPPSAGDASPVRLSDSDGTTKNL